MIYNPAEHTMYEFSWIYYIVLYLYLPIYNIYICIIRLVTRAWGRTLNIFSVTKYKTVLRVSRGIGFHIIYRYVQNNFIETAAPPSLRERESLFIFNGIPPGRRVSHSFILVYTHIYINRT